MKTLRHVHTRHYWSLIIILGSLMSFPAFAQFPDTPYFRLDNYSAQAPISYDDGGLVGPDIHAQLYFGVPGQPTDQFQGLFPFATVSSEPIYRGYLNTEFVSLPSPYFGGETVNVQIRAFNGANWESSTIRGESVVLEKILLHRDHGPNQMQGLLSFSVYSVPEPSALSLMVTGLVGMGVLGYRRYYPSRVKM